MGDQTNGITHRRVLTIAFPIVLSNAPPNAIVVLAEGSKLIAEGFVQPTIGAIHEPLSKHAVES